MSKFNGHKNWNHWNVSLWLNNDYAWYTAMVKNGRYHKSRDIAARRLLSELRDSGHVKTPDGAPYSFSSIRAAMRGLD
jgi:hypothetical protein